MSVVTPEAETGRIYGMGVSGHDGTTARGHHHDHDHGAASCMFCTGNFDPENSLDGAGAAMAEHLALNDDCRDQWKIWKEQVLEEWNGD